MNNHPMPPPDLIHALAKAKARGSPPILRQTAASSYICRWSAVIALAAQRALAPSYLEHHRSDYDHMDSSRVPALLCTTCCRTTDTQTPHIPADYLQHGGANYDNSQSDPRGRQKGVWGKNELIAGDLPGDVRVVYEWLLPKALPTAIVH